MAKVSGPVRPHPTRENTVLASLSALAFAAWSPPAGADTHAAGAVIENAAVLDVTPDGFDAAAEVLPSLIPDRIDIPETGEVHDGAWGQCYLGGYEYDFTNGWVGIVEVTGASLLPQDGYLDLSADMLVEINDSSDPFSLYYSAECIDDTCHGYVDPFTVQVDAKLYLTVVTDTDGNPSLQASITDLTLNYDLTGDRITLEDCSIGTLEEVLNFFGLSLYDFVLGLADSYVQDAVANAVPDIEQQIEDAFDQATINQQLNIGDATVDLNLYPAEVSVTPAGARITLNGSVAAEDQAACIADFDPGGSLMTDSAPPDPGSAPASIPGDYHIALDLSDDFGNQALYAIWRAGALCYQLTPDSSPIPLDTSLLGLLAGDTFDDLFPDPMPMEIGTTPEAPPAVDYGGSHAVDVTVDDLGLDFYAELDGRQARILSLGLKADAGVDPAFDSSTGEMAIHIELSSDDVVATVTDNQFAPGADSEIADNFAGVFDTLVSQVLGSYLDNLVFTLPTYNGVGLTDLQLSQAGDAGDWLGAYAWIGAVSYTGSDSSNGCGGGCASGGGRSGPWTLLGVPLAVALFGRRR